MRTFAALAIALVSPALTLIAMPSVAQTWPQRTVRFVVPLGPGSGADISARLLADRLPKQWAQPVVVENRPGGDGVIAVSAVLSADPIQVLPLPVEMPAYAVKQHWHERYHHDPGHAWLRREVATLFRD